jgi:hypothetical protein
MATNDKSESQPESQPCPPSIQEINVLKAITTEMLMTDGADLSSFKSRYPEMAEKYPAIFVMCCSEFEDAKHRQFATRCVSFMLKKLEDSHTTTDLHEASTDVGEMLFEEYIKPIVEKK